VKLTWDEKRLLRYQKYLSRRELLIVDELGFVPLSKTGVEMLFEILSQSYERSSTLVTSNLLFAEWTEVLGSEDRLLVGCRENDQSLARIDSAPDGHPQGDAPAISPKAIIGEVRLNLGRTCCRCGAFLRKNGSTKSGRCLEWAGL